MSLSLIIKTSHLQAQPFSVTKSCAKSNFTYSLYTLMKAGLRQNREKQLIFVKLNLYAYGDSETASFQV